MDNKDNDNIPKEINCYKIGKLLYSYRNYNVYMGTNSLTKDEVTIKIINKKYINGNQKLLYFVNNEILFTKILCHQNILKSLEEFESFSYIFIIMENFKGEFLSSYMKRNKKLEESKALKIFSKILSAMIYLHNMNICHLNINLESILIDENDENLIKIYDFKYGQYYYTKFKTLSENVGTNMFTSPEMFSIDRYFPELADVWSCGILLCYLLTGEFPINKDKELDIKERYIIPSNISKDLQDLLKNILEVDIDKRYRFDDIIDSKYLTDNNYSKEIMEEINKSYPLDDTNLRKIYERYLRQRVLLGKNDNKKALINFEIIIKREILPDYKRMSKLIEMFSKKEDNNSFIPKRKNIKNNKKQNNKKENEQKLINNSNNSLVNNHRLSIKKKDTFNNFKFNKNKVDINANRRKRSFMNKGVKRKRKSLFEYRFPQKSFLFEIPESLIYEREEYKNFNQFQTKFQESKSNDFRGRNDSKKKTHAAVNNLNFLGSKLSSSVGRRRRSQFAVVEQKYADYDIFSEANKRNKLMKIEEEKKAINNKNIENEKFENKNEIINEESSKKVDNIINNDKPVFNFDELYEDVEESENDKSINSNKKEKEEENKLNNESTNLNFNNDNISQSNSYINDINNLDIKNNKSIINNDNINNINSNSNIVKKNAKFKNLDIIKVNSYMNIIEKKNKDKKPNINNYKIVSLHDIFNSNYDYLDINKKNIKNNNNDSKNENIINNYDSKEFNKNSLKYPRKNSLINEHLKTDINNLPFNKKDKNENNQKKYIKNKNIIEFKNKKENNNSLVKRQNNKIYNSKLARQNKNDDEIINSKMIPNKSLDNLKKRVNNKSSILKTKLNRDRSAMNIESNKNQNKTEKLMKNIYSSLFTNSNKNLITKNNYNYEDEDEDENSSPHFFSKTNTNKNGKKNNYFTSNNFNRKIKTTSSGVRFSDKVVVYNEDDNVEEYSEEEDTSQREEKKFRRNLKKIQRNNNLKAVKLEGEKAVIKKFINKAKTPDHKGILKKPSAFYKNRRGKSEDISNDEDKSMTENKSYISKTNSVASNSNIEPEINGNTKNKKSSGLYNAILKNLKDLNTVFEQNEEDNVFQKYVRRKITPEKINKRHFHEIESSNNMNDNNNEIYNKNNHKNYNNMNNNKKNYRKNNIDNDDYNENVNDDSNYNEESNNNDENNNYSEDNDDDDNNNNYSENNENDNNNYSEDNDDDNNKYYEGKYNNNNDNNDYYEKYKNKDNINDNNSEIENYIKKIEKKYNKSNLIKNKNPKNFKNKNNIITNKSDNISENFSSYNNIYKNNIKENNALDDVENFNFVNDEYNKIKFEMTKKKNTMKKNTNSKSFLQSNGKQNETETELTSDEQNQNNNYLNNRNIYLINNKKNLKEKLISSNTYLDENKVKPFSGNVIDLKYISLKNYEETIKILKNELKKRGVKYKKIDSNSYECSKGIRLFFVDIVKIPKNLYYYRFYSKRKRNNKFK